MRLALEQARGQATALAAAAAAIAQPPSPAALSTPPTPHKPHSPPPKPPAPAAPPSPAAPAAPAAPPLAGGAALARQLRCAYVEAETALEEWQLEEFTSSVLTMLTMPTSAHVAHYASC
jgi:hypothetical protein